MSKNNIWGRCFVSNMTDGWSLVGEVTRFLDVIGYNVQINWV